MKKIISLALLLCCIQLTAMDNNSSKLTFIVAQKGEDLSAYKELLLKVYPEFATDAATKEALKQLLIARFATLTNWIGQKGKLFVKVHDGQKPVGFLTLESLDEQNTRIAIHHSPLLPEYLAKAHQFLGEQVKAQFPHAKTMYSSASGKAPKLQELVKSLGFEQDDSYKPNSELVPDSNGFVGYRKNL